jgi:hypothetical protein
MTLIEDVARLKELECASRKLLCDRQEYAEKMASTAPALLDVLGAFQEGDVVILGLFVDFMNSYNPNGHLDASGPGSQITNQQAADCLARLADAAGKMEAMTTARETFNLEEARYHNSHQRRLLKYSQPRSPNRCHACEFSPDEMDAMLDEIERLRADLEQSEIRIRARMDVIDDQAARIKELERALVDERARYNANEEGFSWEYLARKEPDLQEEYRFIARQELREEGEIGAVVE